MSNRYRRYRITENQSGIPGIYILPWLVREPSEYFRPRIVDSKLLIPEERTQESRPRVQDEELVAKTRRKSRQIR